MEVFELDLFDLTRLECLVDGDYSDELILSTAVPFSIVLCTLVCRAVVVTWSGGKMIDEGSSAGLQYVLQALYFIIPPMAATTGEHSGC